MAKDSVVSSADIFRGNVGLVSEAEWPRCAEDAYHLGFEYEKRYHGCGQCVLAAVQDSLGLFEEAAFNAVFEAATGLAGGLGLCGDATCSAFTGAALAFGLLYPRRRAHFGGDRKNRYRTYALIQRLHERFVGHFGSVRCHDVHRHELGRAFDLRDPAEREAFAAAGAHEDKCTGIVACTAKWVVEIVGRDAVCYDRP
jgi:C_GCAxxG_C_C family probable redox protein